MKVLMKTIIACLSITKTTNFTFDEAKTLVSRFVYIQDNRGKTSGSRVAFVSTETKHIIRLHKPHPENELKMYQIDELIEALKSQVKKNVKGWNLPKQKSL